MGILSAIPIVGGILEKVIGVVDKAVVDKDQAAKLKAEIEKQLVALDYSAMEKELDARAAIIVAEAKSDSWITKSWRPMLMVMFGFIVFHLIVLTPVFGIPPPDPEAVPDRLWDILLAGITGYIVGRSGEKMVKSWKGK